MSIQLSYQQSAGTCTYNGVDGGLEGLLQLDTTRALPCHNIQTYLENHFDKAVGRLDCLSRLVCLYLPAQEFLDVVLLGRLLGVWQAGNYSPWILSTCHSIFGGVSDHNSPSGNTHSHNWSTIRIGAVFLGFPCLVAHRYTTWSLSLRSVVSSM